MKVQWTPVALVDVGRLHEFLRPVARGAADRIRDQILAAPDRLVTFPRIGQRLDGFGEREVRRLPVGDYELRYEVRPGEIRILRVFHGREDR